MKDTELNEALLFAADYFIKSNHNSGKPAFLNSIRVAQLALKMNYEREIVIAAALHDLIEDTDCTILDIQKK